MTKYEINLTGDQVKELLMSALIEGFGRDSCEPGIEFTDERASSGYLL